MDRPDNDHAARWDRKYAAGGGALFGSAPNAALVALVRSGRLAGGSALLLADGDGRNGRWLAADGWRVTAVERSAVATAQARESDARAGVEVEREIADLAEWNPPAGRRWDLVAILYLHGPERLRERVLRLGAEALSPGGRLLLEGFSTAQAGDPAMGPDDTAKLYDLDRAEAWAGALQVEEALAGRVRLDEGESHRGLASVVRLVARMPGDA